MSRTVLVTGSSGHLGSALMLSLPSLGYDPIGIDILPSPTTTIVGSIADADFLSSLFRRHSFHSVLHTATLHKPHVGSHSKTAFIDVNITGTTLLLEHAAASKCASFIFTSSTTTFGRALSPRPGDPAAWIDESVVPKPKNIYGVTKVCAEDLCELIHSQTGIPVIVLRTSRFFPEADDVEARRAAYDDQNLKINELTYRRVDIADVVSAHVCAMKSAASAVRWGKYIISAPSPFSRDEETLRMLDSDAGEAIRLAVPEYEEAYSARGWKFLDRIDRVYDSRRAIRELGWSPEYTFQRALEKISRGEEWRSDLTLQVGKKGYHAEPTGVYTTAASPALTNGIRREEEGDEESIRDLLSRCFPTTSEAKLVDTLRRTNALRLSLVASSSSSSPTIVSHVALSGMRSPPHSLALGPVTTLASQRKLGLASSLIRRAIQWARDDDEGKWERVFVLGDPEFYGRFGFSAGVAEGLESRYKGKYLLGLELKKGVGGGAEGVLEYDEAFEMVDS